RSAGPGGPFRVLSFVTPHDEDHVTAWFYRLRHVRGWPRALWRITYPLYLERNHWNVVEQDRLILESQRGLSSRLHEHLSQSDVGTVHLRRMLNRELDRQQAVYAAGGAGGESSEADVEPAADIEVEVSGCAQTVA
ncbi:MAG: SRPBCC family protein, partial [Chloroflexota bacterium]